MAGVPYRSYVAIGDSLSEGLGDFTFNQKREHNGWTDRLAALLSMEAAAAGEPFHFANLALRGAKLRVIMSKQLELALSLQPDLVTVMAGSNDFMTKDIVALEETFRTGLRRLKYAGSDVVVANTIRPAHLRFFSWVLPKANRVSEMLIRVALEENVKVLDVHGIHDFKNLAYWCEDMVHFSGHGHIRVANEAAEVLGLQNRLTQTPPHEMHAPNRNLKHTLRWYRVYVIPFIKRRIKGTTSGDGMTSKHLNLVPFSNLEFEIVPLASSASSQGQQLTQAA